jgi:SAM-dependent methyltransferase
MTAQELFDRATDPRQYDGAELDWPSEGVLESPSMQFFHHHLGRELGDLHGRSVLDIGCGTGHLFTLFAARGAGRVVGIEPAARSAEIARRNHPGLEVIGRTLIEATIDPGFDLAVAVMSFEHQPDLGSAFRRVAALLVTGGRFILISADPEFHATPRPGVEIETHPWPDGAVLVATRYPYGTIHDVVRPPAHLERAARTAGLVPVRATGLAPTAELMAAEPSWSAFADRAVARLAIFAH